MRTALLHCGLHKTGTTAVQNALRDHAAALPMLGYFVPRSGRLDAMGGGHHELAWQLTGDRRLDTRTDHLAALEQELAAQPGNPILSSEDFESALADPALFAPLVRVLRKHCDELTLVIYLRDQLSYLEALYLEQLNQGMLEHLNPGRAIDYAGFVEQVLRDGVARLPGSTFLFDYRHMLDTVAAAGLGRLVVRNYHTLAGGSSVADLCAVLGVPVEQTGPAATARPNQRAPIAHSLLRYLHNHARREPDQYEQRAIADIVARIGTCRVASARATRLRMVERFRPGNLVVCDRYGLARNGLGLRDAGSLDPDLSLERLFSATTRELIGAIAEALRGERTELADRLISRGVSQFG